MARATLKIWRDGDFVRSKLESLDPKFAFEGKAPLSCVENLSKKWRDLDLRRPLSDTQQCDIGRAISEDVLGLDVSQSLAWFGTPRDGSTFFHLGLEVDDEFDSLTSLPWELLNLDGSAEDGFFTLVPRVSLTRTASGPSANETFPHRMRVLVAYANPNSLDYPLLAHLNREVFALRSLFDQYSSVATMDRLADAKPADLCALLARDRYDVVHFCGHAERTAQGGHLILQGPNLQEAVALEASELADWLLEAGVRFVFLSACETSGNAESVVETLIRKGIPAAVGMQTPARDETQTQFVLEFYREILRGHPCSEAISVARAARRFDPHWWAPTLTAIPGRHILVAGSGTETGAELPPTSLPSYSSPFFGREAELEKLTSALLTEPDKVINLIGLGGSGKSRLAAELGLRMRLRVDGLGAIFRDGIVMIDCTSIDHPAELYSEIARALDFQLGDKDHASDLQSLLANARALIILDCVDGLQEAESAAAVSDLQVSGGARIVCTCRRRLGVAKELPFEVGPLSGSDDPEQDESTKLFVSIAKPRKPFDAAALKTIHRICRQIEGSPLAIEMVAARLRYISLQEIAEYVEARPAAGIGEIVKESIRLLTPANRELLLRLTLFRSSFTLTDAAEVLAQNRLDLQDQLQALVANAMLLPFESGEDMRYRILDVIRETLGQTESEEDIGRFITVFSGRAATYRRTEKSDRKGANELFWSNLPNIQNALRLALPRQEDESICTIADAVLLPYFEAGYWTELDDLFPQATASADRIKNTNLLLRVLGIRGALLGRRFDREQCKEAWKERLALAREVGNFEVEADALIDLGCQEVQDSNVSAAPVLFDEAERALSNCDRPDLAATVEVMRARLSLDAADDRSAVDHVQRAERYADKAQEKDSVMFVLSHVALNHLRRGDRSAAIRRFRELIGISLEGNRRFHLQSALLHLGVVLLDQGDYEEGARCVFAGELIANAIAPRFREGLHEALMKLKKLPQDQIEAIRGECNRRGWKLVAADIASKLH